LKNKKERRGNLAKRKKLKSKDKVVQKVTRDGLVEENLSQGTSKSISQKIQDIDIGNLRKDLKENQVEKVEQSVSKNKRLQRQMRDTQDSSLVQNSNQTGTEFYVDQSINEQSLEVNNHFENLNSNESERNYGDSDYEFNRDENKHMEHGATDKKSQQRIYSEISNFDNQNPIENERYSVSSQIEDFKVESREDLDYKEIQKENLNSKDNFKRNYEEDNYLNQNSKESVVFNNRKPKSIRLKQKQAMKFSKRVGVEETKSNSKTINDADKAHEDSEHPFVDKSYNPVENLKEKRQENKQKKYYKREEVNLKETLEDRKDAENIKVVNEIKIDSKIDNSESKQGSSFKVLNGKPVDEDNPILGKDELLNTKQKKIDKKRKKLKSKLGFEEDQSQDGKYKKFFSEDYKSKDTVKSIASKGILGSLEIIRKSTNDREDENVGVNTLEGLGTTIKKSKETKDVFSHYKKNRKLKKLDKFEKENNKLFFEKQGEKNQKRKPKDF
jgi:hypothetical protein